MTMRRPRRLRLLGAGVAILVAACSPNVNPPVSAGPPTTATPSSTQPMPLPSTLPTTATVETVTQLCEAWGASAPDDLILCGDAIWLALDAMGPAGGPAWRAEFRYGPSCVGPAPCGGRTATMAHVIVRTPSLGSFVVDVTRDEGGGLAVWPPQPTRDEPFPAFSPPQPARADVGPGAPTEIADREAFPLCGDETAGIGGPYDRAARQCFVDGVLAATKVEFLTRQTSTEGDPVLTLYRFGGGGPVIRFIADGGQWMRYACGLALSGTEAVFFDDGECARRAVDE